MNGWIETAMGKIVAVAALGFLLAACTGPQDWLGPDDYQLRNKGWKHPAVAATPTPAYCYHTLAKPNCYPEPQAGQQYRIINHYGPRPE
ncbi:MAG: hypothetical protein HY057_03015 [Rhodospirillales bacterium]|nr:hypothetical protein [Rhodospirillales bacterium]